MDQFLALRSRGPGICGVSRMQHPPNLYPAKASEQVNGRRTPHPTAGSGIDDIDRTKTYSHNTYKGLKPDNRRALRPCIRNSHNTYKGLKLVYDYSVLPFFVHSHNTYKGLKLPQNLEYSFSLMDSHNTYKGLKQPYNTIIL